MTINITYNNEPYEEIIKARACVIGLSISNQSSVLSSINLDDLQFTKPYIKLNRNLPNGMSVEFLIHEISEIMYEKYKNFTTLSVSFENISIEATI